MKITSHKKKTIGIIVTLSFATFITVTQGNGCTGKFSATSSSSSGEASDTSSIPDTSGNVDSGIPIIPGAKTVSLVYSKQVLDQMTTCAGVSRPSDTTLAMYDQKKGAVSVYGTANTITGPMMMAVTSIAGEVCNDLLNQEATATSSRIFAFNDKNFSTNMLPSTTEMNDAISRLGLSCWQRIPDSNERAVISSMIADTIKNGDSKASRSAALMICTSMLSSLDALLN